MTYTPYLIANYATGLDQSRQPWLLPNDAQEELYDGFVYRGVKNKRQGYSPYATGQKGDYPYTESRLVNNIQLEQTGLVNNGAPKTFSTNNSPVARGSITVSDGVNSYTDNGIGAFPTSPTGLSNIINYNTGMISGFTFPSASSNPITVTYNYYPGLPIMGIMTFIAANNFKQLLVADTQRVNIYSATTNTLDYSGPVATITGITNANPGVVTTAAVHNLTTNDEVFIYQTQGINLINNNSFTITVIDGTSFSIGVDTTVFGAYTSGGIVELIYTGDNTNFWSWVNYADGSGDPRLIFTNNKDEVQYYAPNLSPLIGDYINYPSAASPQFFMDTDAASPVPITSILCLLVFEFKDRLLMLRTTENGVIKPRRIRISGTGASSDDFRTSATGAGFIDIPDGSWIQGAAFNRDDLIIFTENSTWVLKYTGNDTTPFVINKIDESRGCQAAFAAITYLNRTTAISPRGMIVTDGYRVDRMDDSIPDFSYNAIDNANFDLCFAGSVDVDRDHYLLYPTPGQTTSPVRSQRILVTNYEEDNYCIYRIPLSCMGTWTESSNITWADLIIYDNWAQFAAVYGNWNSFVYNSGAPISLGGGHFGEVFKLNVAEVEDNTQKIRNVTVIDDVTLQVTTDWNNYSLNTLDQQMGADNIFLTGLVGMLEANDKQYQIISVINHYTFQVRASTLNFSSYTSGGVASRVIPFSSLMKKFNPYVNGDKKVRCGWLYMYVGTSDTDLRDNIAITNITQSNPCVVTTNINNNYYKGQSVSLFDVGGMFQVNNMEFFVTPTSPNTFSLNGIDSTGYTAYTSGGYSSTSELCKLAIDIITDDNDQNTQLRTLDPYQGTCTNLIFQNGSKKWYKTFINQTGRFIQFRFRNTQAGSTIEIQAIMPGFQPVGRLI